MNVVQNITLLQVSNLRRIKGLSRNLYILRENTRGKKERIQWTRLETWPYRHVDIINDKLILEKQKKNTKDEGENVIIRIVSFSNHCIINK